MENIVLKIKRIVNGNIDTMSSINPRIKENNNGFTISYLEHDKTSVILKISSESCIILRKGVYKTNIHLNLKGFSYARITSEMGVIEVPIECKEIYLSDKCWGIHYIIEDGSDVFLKWILLKN